MRRVACASSHVGQEDKKCTLHRVTLHQEAHKHLRIIEMSDQLVRHRDAVQMMQQRRSLNRQPASDIFKYMYVYLLLVGFGIGGRNTDGKHRKIFLPD